MGSIFNNLPSVDKDDSESTVIKEPIQAPLKLVKPSLSIFDNLPSVEVSEEETDPLNIFNNLTPVDAPVPNQKLPETTGSEAFILMEEISNQEGPLNKEAVVNNPTLIEGIRSIMKSRYSADTRNKWTLDEKYDRTISDEDLYEEWQNWMRSLEGGQTVTTANDIAWFASADDNQRALLGASFDLFDAHPFIFSKDTSWSEMGDGLRDYAKAGIWDPTTLLGLGFGRIWTGLGAKAGGMAFRITAKKVAKEALERGLSKQAAKRLQSESLKKSFKAVGLHSLGKYASMAGVDVISSVGADYYNQQLRIGSGNQEQYSVPQSVGAALGVIVLPSLIAGMKGVGNVMDSKFVKDNVPGFAKYMDMYATFGNKSKADIEKAVIDQVDLSKVNSNLRVVFERFKNDLDLKEFLPYMQAKDEAVEAVTKKGIAGNPLQQETFFEAVISRNFIEAMSDAGFKYAAREKNDNVSKFISDALKYLDDGTVIQFKEAFQSQFGELPETIKKLKTGEDVSNWFLSRGRGAGEILQVRSNMSKILGKQPGDITIEDMLKGAGRSEEVTDGPQRIKYLQSLWKRALTSHPSTLGLNIKGWAYTHSMNIAADVVAAALFTTKAGVSAVRGSGTVNTDLTKAKGSLLGALRRGLNLLSPDATIKSAENYIRLRPEIGEKLFAERAGGVDNLKILENLGLDPKAKVNQLSEKAIDLLQTAMGVKLQDEVTKMISFSGHLDTNIMKQYGMSFNEFMSQPNAYGEMFTPKYLKLVQEPAIDSAKRETYSISWANVKGKSFPLAIAQSIEKFSNAKLGGLLLPFGRFFNTATATLGDITMINAVRHVTKSGLKSAGDDRGIELFSKGIMGIGLIYGGLPGGSSNFEEAKEKIKLGLTWDKTQRNDGSIGDETFEFPGGYVELLSQVAAHMSVDGAVPPALKEELAAVLVSNAFRDSGEVYYTLKDFGFSLLEEDNSGRIQKSLELLGAGFARVASGLTRSAEPLNQAIMFNKGDFSQPDLRQGTTSQQIINRSLKYVNQFIPPIGEIPTKETSTRGKGNSFVDPGRSLGGVRTAAPLTPSERLFGGIGAKAWQEVQWGGSPEYKNRLDGLVSDILNYESSVAIEEDDYFNLSLTKRIETVKKVKEKVRTKTLEVLSLSTNATDEMLVIESKILKKNKSYIREALKISGYEGEIEDLKGELGGKEKLEYILYIIDNRDDTIFRDLIYE